jgi:hypothetical protein
MGPIYTGRGGVQEICRIKLSAATESSSYSSPAPLPQHDRAPVREGPARIQPQSEAPGRPPTIEGLFGSSRFGFDADLVLALDYSQRQRDSAARTEQTRLLVLKNRHGPEAHGENGIPIELDFSSFRVRDLTPENAVQGTLEEAGAA